MDLHVFTIKDEKGNKIIDNASIMKILNMHEVKEEEEIHIYIDIDTNVDLLIIKMPKCYKSKPNIAGRSTRIKYFPDYDDRN